MRVQENILHWLHRMLPQAIQFKKASEQGSVKAKFYLGLIYRRIALQTKIDAIVDMGKNNNINKDVENLEVDASKCFAEACPILISMADHGDAEAQMILGWIYGGLWEGNMDEDTESKWNTKALENFSKLAELGSSKAMRNIGDIYARLKNESEYTEWYIKAANKGDPIAQYEIGFYYKISKKDYAKAIEWLTKAAEQGHIEAQYELANIFDRGAWTSTEAAEMKSYFDDTQSIKWYTEAATKGHMNSQYQLGMSYKYDEQIKDYDESIKWYTLAAEQGHFDSQYALGSMYYFGREIPQNYDKAFKWIKMAVEQGGSQFDQSLLESILADMYFYGEGISKDYNKALTLLMKLGEQGDRLAQYKTGEIYYEGLGVKKNVKNSAIWYIKAAESGYELAQYRIARMYFEGDGVIQDYVEAYKWANLAAMKEEKNRGLRDTIKKVMTAEQIAEAQKLAREFKPVNSR